MFFNHCHHRNSDRMNMDDVMDSTLFKVVTVGALVYLGAKAVRHMMD
jgi:hypothetical protein